MPGWIIDQADDGGVRSEEWSRAAAAIVEARVQLDALGRSDLGRLRPGAKADFVIVKIDSLRSGPIEDPLRNLVNCCTSADIESVWVGGRKVVDRGRIVGVDEVPIMNVMRDEIDRKRARLASSPTGDRFPPSLPVWEELPSP